MKVIISVLYCCIVASSQAFLFDSIFGSSKAEWNGLKAIFGLNPFNSFYSQPRTVDEAIKDGWTKDISAGGCGMAGTKFNGIRYRKGNEQAIMLLFDVNGYIAGIQAGIPKTLSTYPAPQNAKHKVFNEEKDMWVITAYFTEPAKICTTGRNETEFTNEGTGTMLAFQTGATASNLMRIPMDEQDVTTKTNFIAGRCFYTMGMHYWYDISKTWDCDDIFPVFLLYNNKRLNAFGWAFNPNYNNSNMWEHATKSQFETFMEVAPPCLGNDGPVTTLHIYMTDSPRTNFC